MRNTKIDLFYESNQQNSSELARLSQAREMIYDVFESDPNYLLCVSDSNFFLSRATDTSNLSLDSSLHARSLLVVIGMLFFRRSSRSFPLQRVQLPWCWIFNILISCSSFHLHFSFHPINSYKSHQQVSPYVLSPPSHHHSAVKKQRYTLK